ncbi:hypothetical protein MHYP_G00136690 [Metynnis hypsauchen]
MLSAHPVQSAPSVPAPPSVSPSLFTASCVSSTTTSKSLLMLCCWIYESRSQSHGLHFPPMRRRRGQQGRSLVSGHAEGDSRESFIDSD